MSDPYDLERFLAAQENIYPDALAEIKRRQKRGHWMWFVFPQITGLGSSPTAQHFAIRSLDEARAYLASGAGRTLPPNASRPCLRSRR